MIREVLEEIEAMKRNARTYFTYASYIDPIKADHVELLRKAGFPSGKRDGSLRDVVIVGADLTWSGHDLLDTIRSKGIWNKIKTTAKTKGIVVGPLRNTSVFRDIAEVEAGASTSIWSVFEQRCYALPRSVAPSVFP